MSCSLLSFQFDVHLDLVPLQARGNFLGTLSRVIAGILALKESPHALILASRTLQFFWKVTLEHLVCPAISLIRPSGQLGVSDWQEEEEL